MVNSISGKRVLVTGGAGFVGSTTIDLLLAAGAGEVRVLDNLVRGNRRNLESAMQSGRVKFIGGDIRDVEVVDDAVAGVNFIVHLAALRITRCAIAPREGVDVLINGTVNVLESAVKHGVEKIVAASSASVYGDPSYLPMDESHPFNNRTLYGAAKIANEQLLRSYYEMFKLPYVAFRYFNIYGPRMDLDGVYTEVLVRWADAIDAGVRPKIFGDGSQSMDFVYVEDVAKANVMALTSMANDEVFNIGTGKQTSLCELLDLLLRMSKSSLQPEFLPARTINNVQARRADVTKAREMLGFSADVTLEAGLRALTRWRNEVKAELVPVEGVAQ